MGDIETVLEEIALEPRKSTLVAGTELQERINSLFRKQEILLHPDFLVYLSLKLEGDHGISNASNIINPDYLGEDGVIVSQDLIQAVDSIAKDVDSKGGIDPEYLSLVRMVNPESARNLVFQAKELLTNILGSTLKSEKKFLQFFVEEDLRYRKGILQGCIERKIEEFPSNFYQEINLIVNVLKKIDEERNIIGRRSTEKKSTRKFEGVSNKEFEEKLRELHEKQDLFAYNNFLEYVRNKLTKQGIKRNVRSMEHYYLNKRQKVSREVMSALESIANDIELRGGIDPSEAHLGKIVYSKRIADIMDNAERIIEGRYKKKFKTLRRRDDYFAEVASATWNRIKNYRLDYSESAPSKVFEKLYEFVRVLNLTGKQRKEKHINKPHFPSEYFYDTDDESRGKRTNRKSGGVYSKEFDEKLRELHEKQNLFPYNNFLEYVKNKLTKQGIRRSVLSMRHGYLKKEFNVPGTVMSGLESIANEIKRRGGIDPSEAHLGKRVYSERIVDMIAKAEKIIEGRYKKRFISRGFRDDYFAEVASVSVYNIRAYRLGYTESAEHEVFEKLREFARVLNLTGKERKKKHIDKPHFPSEYFYDMNGESQEPEKITEEIKHRRNYGVIHRTPRYSRKVDLERHGKEKSVPRTEEGLVIYDMGLSFKIEQEFYHRVFGTCTVLDIPDETKMVVRTETGEEKKLVINKKT